MHQEETAQLESVVGTRKRRSGQTASFPKVWGWICGRDLFDCTSKCKTYGGSRKQDRKVRPTKAGRQQENHSSVTCSIYKINSFLY